MFFLVTVCFCLLLTDVIVLFFESLNAMKSCMFHIGATFVEKCFSLTFCFFGWVFLAYLSVRNSMDFEALFNFKFDFGGFLIRDAK